MNFIFFGPQGSGKGTQAERIAGRYGLCHISSGDLLRHVEGNLKDEVREVMQRGDLVSDDLMVRVLKERLDRGDCKDGIILDGFPRNVAQAKLLKGIINIDKAIEIAISDDEAVRRISGRRICKSCDSIFNVNGSSMPKVEGVCDKCGGELIKRKDDNEEALRERLKIYHVETERVLNWYKFMRINGEQSIEKVESDIIDSLGKLS